MLSIIALPNTGRVEESKLTILDNFNSVGVDGNGIETISINPQMRVLIKLVGSVAAITKTAKTAPIAVSVTGSIFLFYSVKIIFNPIAMVAIHRRALNKGTRKQNSNL
jgi:hypothetical protein